MTKAILLRPDKAGDAIKTLPALRGLRRRFSPEELEIHLLASPANASLFACEPGLVLHTLPTIPTQSFDLAINLLADPSEQSRSLLQQLHATRKIETHFSPVGKPETKNIASILSHAFDVDIPLATDLAPILSDADFRQADAALGEKSERWLGLCPLAGMQRRTLPLGRWHRLLQTLQTSSRWDRIFLFGGPGDESRLTSLLVEKARLVFPISFRALGAYLARMDGVIAVDSGPLHLARSLRLPSLGILSGGDRARWFPEEIARSRLLRRGIFSSYPSSWEILSAYQSWLKC